MQKKTLQEAKARLVQNRNRQIRKRIISALACIVVFCTTYALILPAITLEKNQCGKTEHTHTEACYSQGTTHSVKKPICSEERLEIHEHTEDCYNKDGDLICGFADFVIHEHDSVCYGEDGKLWCKLPEIEAHTHTKKCYDDPEKVKEHKHTEECYTTQRGELICTKSETPHTHTKDCYTESKTLVCSKPESDGHHHSEACYDESGELICGQKESDGHHHGEDCYKTTSELTCKLSEESHKHTDKCYAQKKMLTCNISEGSLESGGAKLICGKDEIIPHKHTKKSCYETDKNGNTYLICDKPEILEHQHTDDCFETVEEPADDKELICGKEEHTHTDECREKVETTDANALTLESMSDPHAVANISEVQPRSIMRFAVRRNATATTRSLRSYITDVTLQHKVGNDWKDIADGEKVKKGETVRFNLKYQLPGKTLSEDNNTITYKLPDGIKMVNAESGKVRNQSGEEVGTYTITQDGTVTIVFNDDYVKKNQDGNQIDGYIAVEANVNNIDSAGNKIDIAFTDNLKVEVEIDEPIQENSDITVTKSSKDVDKDKGTVTYTITVKSENGTGDKVTLTDVMKDLKLNGTGDFTITGPNGAENSPVTSTDNGFKIVLPKMNAGETYTITYKAKLSEIPVSGVTAKNTVNVESTKKEDGTKIEDSSSIDTWFSQAYVSKNGDKPWDQDKIKWTITVNAGKQDISNWTLKDILNGEEVKGPVTLTDSSGKSMEITLPYTFPAGSKDTYKITYETPPDKLIGESNVKNKAELTPSDGKPGASDEYTWWDGSTYNPLSKKADSLTMNGDKKATIQWTVTIDTKEGDIKAPWFYTDKLQSGQYFTDEQIEDLQKEIKKAVEGKNLNYTFEKVIENNLTVGYKLNFSNSMKKGQKFTFTYNSTASLGEANKELTFANNAGINDKVWASGSIQYKPLVRKYDPSRPDGSDTSHDYYDTVMDKNGTLKWGFVVTVPEGYKGGDLIVTERLPEGVTLTQLTMKADGVHNDEVDITKDGTHTVADKTVTTAQTGQEIKITIPRAIAENANLKEIQFYIQAKINDDFSWPTEDGMPKAPFNNKVTVNSEDGKLSDTDDQTQTVTKNKYTDVVSKGHDKVEDNIIPYKVTINPNGVDLLEGSDELTLVDTVNIYDRENYSISLVPNSVRVFRIKQDGTEEQVDRAEVPYTFEVIDGTDVNNPSKEYVLRMTLPDKIPLRVEYQYKINGQVGQWISITNKAKLEGIGESNTESSTQEGWNITSSSAGASVDGLTLVKVDKESYAVTLKDAEFELYRYDGETYKKVDGDYISSADGKISIKGLEYNRAYYLKEVKSPEGYILDETPYYFYIANSDTATYPENKPSGFEGKEHRGGDTVYIPNESENTKIRVNKHWFSSDGTETTDSKNSGEISFKLYRIESVNPPEDGSANNMVKLKWYGLIYGTNPWIDKEPNPNDLATAENGCVPIGTKVTVTLKPQDSQGIEKVPMSINGKEVLLKQKEGTSEFSYTFIIEEDTELLMVYDHHTCGENTAWKFAGSTYSWSFEAAQMPEPTKPTGTEIGSYTISSKNGWKWSSEDEETLRDKLPKTGLAEDGKTTVYYTYYVEEAAVTNYETSYENNDGIVSGTIMIKNTGDEQPSYELPETGGFGKTPYTAGGLATICTGLFLMCFSRKRKKENLA